MADRLVSRVLALEAHANALDVSTLQATPPGRRRRALHDDLTAVVIRLGPDGPLLSRKPGSAITGPVNGSPASIWSALSSFFGPVPAGKAAPASNAKPNGPGAA